jgi:hypothetical protein
LESAAARSFSSTIWHSAGSAGWVLALHRCCVSADGWALLVLALLVLVPLELVFSSNGGVGEGIELGTGLAAVAVAEALLVAGCQSRLVTSFTTVAAAATVAATTNYQEHELQWCSRQTASVSVMAAATATTVASAATAAAATAVARVFG